MAQKRVVRNVLLTLIGALLVGTTVLAYHAVMAPWRGDVRETLVAMTFVAVTYFIFCNIGLRLAEIRERAKQKDAQK
jgi:hypothetical protein